MNYVSSRNRLYSLSLSAAIQEGLARDGGLFLPEQMPFIKNPVCLSTMSLPEFASALLEDFFKGDALASSLKSVCERTFNFIVPLKELDENTAVLELFHGPTCSFKDFGARFLAECLNSMSNCKKTILVATSGDTGSAVASAFHRKTNFKVIILYPQDQISAKQEKQMTSWDDNILACAVKGNFDQCQQLVKAAFQDPYCQSLADLSSANSINIGRLLPQMTYYARSSLQFYNKTGLKAGFIIPSGNLGNATAAYWAKAMGFPIRQIVLATNANRVISDYLEKGHYETRPGIKTLANAMDVGNPNNFERLARLFGSFKDFKENVRAFSVSDETIRQTIDRIYKQYNYICCPHTATAFHVRSQLDSQAWIVVSTADPCKFDELIEPIINSKVPLAPQLEKLLEKPNKVTVIDANLEEIRKLLKM